MCKHSPYLYMQNKCVYMWQIKSTGVHMYVLETDELNLVKESKLKWDQ